MSLLKIQLASVAALAVAEPAGLPEVAQVFALLVVIASGVAGGLARWITLSLSLREGLLALVIGAICAVYLGPIMLPAVRYFYSTIDLPSDPGDLAGFLAGVGGASIIGGILDVINRKTKPKPENVAGDDDA